MKKNKSGMSLRTKLLGLTVGLIICLGLASFAIFRYVIWTQVKQEIDIAEAHSDGLGDAVAAQFYERYGDVQAFAINPDLKSVDAKKMAGVLNTYAAMYGIYDLILVVDNKGKLISVNDKDPDGKSLNVKELYQKDFSKTPWFTSVMSGATTDDKEKGFSGTYVENIQIDPWTTLVWGTSRLGSSFSAPIKDAKGITIGVVSNRASSRWFEAPFQETYIALKKSSYGSSIMSFYGKDGTLFFEYSPSLNGGKLEPKYNWDTLIKTVVPGAGRWGGFQEKSLKTNESTFLGRSPIKGKKFIEGLGWYVAIEDDADQVLDSLEYSQKIFNFVFLAILGVSIGLSFLFSRALSRSLEQLATKLAKGSEEVLEASTSISESSRKLSDASIEQAAAIQETAASIDEVSSMVKKSAENAAQSQKSSQSSTVAANEGQRAVEKMIQSIDEISKSNNEILAQVEAGNREISEIVKVIGEIGNKTKVINDIVFQTKLLSFNASVEAARAGEHGKGFAVVAEEVGNLAQMSGNAAKEISTMLDTSIQKVESIVNSTKGKVSSLMVENKAKVSLGTDVAKQCGSALKNILGTVQEVDVMVREISAASKEQAQGVAEINKAINQLDQVTRQNATSAQASASSAGQLGAFSQDLKALVGELNFVVSGEVSEEVFLKTQNTNRSSFQEKFEEQDATVISISSAKNKKKQAKPQNLEFKKASGAESPVSKGASALPSQDDPRFEDI